MFWAFCAGVRTAARRKLEHELNIKQSDIALSDFTYLTRIHYLAPSDGVWGEHEGWFGEKSNTARRHPLLHLGFFFFMLTTLSPPSVPTTCAAASRLYSVFAKGRGFQACTQ